MSYEVRNPEIEARLEDIGEKLRKAIAESGQPYGFTLLIFSFGESGNMFYISNAERESMCNAMREFIARHEPN